ncbi:AAA family ATPase [Nocardia sp. NPDC058658]|uniref:AAA family ATPase n=1 Tax=Nocardia sp. NPDC058658 TaxID=3346580 RepID=UPI003668FD1A
MRNPDVGRHAEMARLRAAVVAAASGAGRFVLVSGAAGIGKSWLAERVATVAAEAGLRVVRGNALDDAGMPPLWPWRRAARELPELGPALDTVTEPGGGPAAQRFRMFTEVADVLTAAAEPSGLLLVLEDLHWSDPTSLALLTHVATETPRTKVLIVGTAREPMGETLLADQPAWLRLPHFQSLPVSGLSEQEVRYWFEQAGRAPDFAPRVHARTDGTPLLVRLVIESGTDIGDDPLLSVPGIRRLILTQLDRLTPDQVDTLGAASILGERIDADLLERVCESTRIPDSARRRSAPETAGWNGPTSTVKSDEGDPKSVRDSAGLGPSPDAVPEQGAVDPTVRDQVSRAIDAATGAGIIRRFDDGTTGFAHALIRDAIYADLVPSRRAAWHRAAAEELSARGGPDSAVAGAIATHWRQAAGDADSPCGRHWSRRAARSARASAAYAEAIRFGQWAIDASSTASEADRAELLIDLARDEFAAGRVSTSLDHCVEAGALAEQADRADLLAEAGLVVQGVTTPTVMTQLDMLCGTALRLLDPDSHPDLIARILAQRALSAADRGAGVRARELSDQAMRAARGSTDPDVILDAIHARHLSLAAVDFLDERMVLAAKAIDIAADAEQPLAQLWGYVWTADAALQRGDLPAFDDALDHIELLADRRRLPIARWHLLRLRATRAALVGDFPAALASDTAAYELAVGIGDYSLAGLHHAFRGMYAVIAGHIDRDELATALASLAFAPKITIAQLFAPMMHALAGDLDEARALFEPFRRLPDTLEIGPRWSGTVYSVGVGAELLADAETADRVYRAFEGREHHYAADGTGALFCVGSIARIRADSARVAGHLDAAVDLYRHGLAMDTAIGARPFIALGHLGLARTLLARADLPAARATAEQAAAAFRRLEMPHRLAAADALLTEITTATRCADPLTLREREVHDLVATGMTNREIATRLVLSERTVETHVRNILTKLALPNRMGISARRQHG